LALLAGYDGSDGNRETGSRVRSRTVSCSGGFLHHRARAALDSPMRLAPIDQEA
jgi:hypothetical protein